MRSLCRSAAVCFLLSLLAGAQITTSQRSPRFTELEVRVAYENDKGAAEHVKIQLTNPNGVTLGETLTRADGSARFPNISPGIYRVRAIGVDIEEKLSEAFTITDRDISHIEFLQIRLVAGVTRTGSPGAISAAALRVPPRAQEEFDKGVKALKKGSLDEAQKRFTRSTEYYPEFAGAWNNLGVIAKERGQLPEAKSLFERAVHADSGYAPSHVNLAKSLIAEKDYPAALPLLARADAIEPNNAETLALLTMLEYDSGQSAAAIAHAQKVHHLADHDRFAFVHYIAGSALEANGSSADAIAEYRLFLKESPASASAPRVRAAVEALEKKTR